MKESDFTPCPEFPVGSEVTVRCRVKYGLDHLGRVGLVLLDSRGGEHAVTVAHMMGPFWVEPYNLRRGRAESEGERVRVRVKRGVK